MSENQVRRDGYTARELYLMRCAFSEGWHCGNLEVAESMDDWLDTIAADNGGTIAQFILHEADRLFGGLESMQAQEGDKS